MRPEPIPADHQGAHAAPAESAAREYRRPWPAATWWLERRPYVRYVVRETTSLFVVAYALFLLVLAGLGPQSFQAVLAHPLSVALHLPVLLMALWHSITWFNLTPQVIVIWRGRKRVSPRLISGAHYVGWILVSVLILAFVKARSGG